MICKRCAEGGHAHQHLSRNNVWWKHLRRMDTSQVGKQVGHQPLADEFASMLAEVFFFGNPPNPSQPASAFNRAIVVDGGSEICSGKIETK